MSVPGASREGKAAARVENKAGRSVGRGGRGESVQAERGSTKRLLDGGGMSMKGGTNLVRKSKYKVQIIKMKRKKK